ncbi:phosphate ABC transporter permease PstA [Haladaptatus sp. ZSTT2]|uniref:phosphate ABC transporter permease PstA n=1 Tax=Haladaptatus sp. ZSTT2 TaxID=3120515 RepID=UPI00300F005F
MATQTSTQKDGFGQVSRTKGIFFRYALLASALVGIVALTVLLIYVTIDAVEPTSASTSWLLAYAGVFVVPSLLVFGYFSIKNPRGLKLGFATTGLPVAGLLLGTAILVIFIDVLDDDVWFYHMVGVALTAALIWGHRKLRPTANIYEKLLFVLFVGGYVMVGLPGYYHSIPEIFLLFSPFEPVKWFSMLTTFGLAGALLTGRHFARKFENQRTGLVTGGLVFAGAAASAFVALFAGVEQSIGVILFLTVVVPLALFVEDIFSKEHTIGARDGLVIPIVVFGGLFAAELIARTAGFTGPMAWIDFQFLSSLPNPDPQQAGIYSALVGSVMLMVVIVLFSFPIGVGAAVYLEEYAPDNRTTRFIQINISNLAGVPSVVYGLLGLGLFINLLNLGIGSVLVGGMTLSLLILPIVIISSQEAIRAVPSSLRQASYGMGATKWQTIREVVLPRSIPGILTGTILAIGRAIGETAPLIIIAAPTSSFSVPTSLSDGASAMPLQIFTWASYPQQDFQHGVLAAGVVTVLIVLLTMNSIAIVLRNRYQSEN